MATTMMNPTGMTMPGMMGATMPMSPTQPAPSPAMVPRCKMRFEKMTGGMKIHCVCDDKMAATMLQNLCKMMAGSMCSCCCIMNGMVVATCNLTMGVCKCEMTSDGVVFTCISGDKDCGAMIQCCCDCCSGMMQAGCTCMVMMNNMPVCCS